MPDEDHDGHDHEGHRHPPGGFFALPMGDMFENMRGLADRRAIAGEAMAMSVYSFMDGLNVEQLIALRRMLCCDEESRMNQFFDGQIVSILRLVHHVHPDTGKPESDPSAVAP